MKQLEQGPTYGMGSSVWCLTLNPSCLPLSVSVVLSSRVYYCILFLDIAYAEKLYYSIYEPSLFRYNLMFCDHARAQQIGRAVN